MCLVWDRSHTVILCNQFLTIFKHPHPLVINFTVVILIIKITVAHHLKTPSPLVYYAICEQSLCNFLYNELIHFRIPTKKPTVRYLFLSVKPSWVHLPTKTPTLRYMSIFPKCKPPLGTPLPTLRDATPCSTSL